MRAPKDGEDKHDATCNQLLVQLKAVKKPLDSDRVKVGLGQFRRWVVKWRSVRKFSRERKQEEAYTTGLLLSLLGSPGLSVMAVGKKEESIIGADLVLVT